jgi:hypothetical protein
LSWCSAALLRVQWAGQSLAYWAQTCWACDPGTPRARIQPLAAPHVPDTIPRCCPQAGPCTRPRTTAARRSSIWPPAELARPAAAAAQSRCLSLAALVATRPSQAAAGRLWHNAARHARSCAADPHVTIQQHCRPLRATRLRRRLAALLLFTSHYVLVVETATLMHRRCPQLTWLPYVTYHTQTGHGRRQGPLIPSTSLPPPAASALAHLGQCSRPDFYLGPGVQARFHEAWAQQWLISWMEVFWCTEQQPACSSMARHTAWLLVAVGGTVAALPWATAHVPFLLAAGCRLARCCAA